MCAEELTPQIYPTSPAHKSKTPEAWGDHALMYGACTGTPAPINYTSHAEVLSVRAEHLHADLLPIGDGSPQQHFLPEQLHLRKHALLLQNINVLLHK